MPLILYGIKYFRIAIKIQYFRHQKRLLECFCSQIKQILRKTLVGEITYCMVNIHSVVFTKQYSTHVWEHLYAGALAKVTACLNDFPILFLN